MLFKKDTKRQHHCTAKPPKSPIKRSLIKTVKKKLELYNSVDYKQFPPVITILRRHPHTAFPLQNARVLLRSRRASSALWKRISLETRASRLRHARGHRATRLRRLRGAMWTRTWNQWELLRSQLRNLMKQKERNAPSDRPRTMKRLITRPAASQSAPRTNLTDTKRSHHVRPREQGRFMVTLKPRVSCCVGRVGWFSSKLGLPRSLSRRTPSCCTVKYNRFLLQTHRGA